MRTLTTGCLAYFETVHGGLVPCRVVSIDPVNHYMVQFQVTASRAGYQKGSHYNGTTMQIIPRDAVRFRKYGTWILPYKVGA
jgi:hypothetical protein